MAPRKKNKNKSPHPRFRDANSFNRWKGTRDIRPTIWIFCEGDETEPAYFDELKRELRILTAFIEVVPVGAGAGAVVGEAIKKKEEVSQRKQNVPIEFWCVFDREGKNETSDFRNAIQRAEQAEIPVIVSNPAFEFWYLLHFKFTTSPFVNGAELIRDLKHHLPKYDKRKCPPELRLLRDDAIRHAKAVLKDHNNGGQTDKFANPSTYTFHLVEHLLEIGQIPEPEDD